MSEFCPQESCGQCPPPCNCWDHLFNKYIPDSSETSVILRPISKTFINGMAASYDNTYDEILKPYIDKKEFTRIIDRLNTLLTSEFPCCACLFWTYMLSICTLGTSFACTYYVVKQAQIKLEEKIEEINKNDLISRKLHLSYNQYCSTSWLELKILNDDVINVNMNMNINSEQNELKIINKNEVNNNFENNEDEDKEDNKNYIKLEIKDK